MKFRLLLASVFSLGMVLVLGSQIVSGENAKEKKKEEKLEPITLKGNLTANDPLDWQRTLAHHKVHTLQLRRGVKYSITMTANFGPWLRLEDERGNQLAFSNQAAGQSAMLDYTPKEDETIRIVATSTTNRSTGPYTIKIGQLVPVLLVNDKLTKNDPFDRVRRQHHCKVHELKMKPGHTYIIHSTTTDHDGYLRLEDSKGNQLAFNDDWQNTRNSRIVFTPQKEDTYRIIQTTFSGGAIGAYTLTVTKQ